MQFDVILSSDCESTKIETESSIEDIQFTSGLDQTVSQLIKVKNTISDERSDPDYCGAYNCTLSMQSGQLPPHLTNAFQLESSTTYSITINGTSGSANQESKVVFACSMVDWPSSDYPSVTDFSK